MKNLNKILLIVAIMLVSQPSISFSTETSAGKYTVLAPLPCIESAETTYIDSQGQSRTNPGIKCLNGNGAIAKEVDFKTYVQYTMNLLIALSAVVAVVMLVWGGIEYMYTSSFSSKKSGLERAQNALVGLLLVLTSYIILRTVDPRLVEIPNTLVPQLTVREELREDARALFMAKIDGEIEESNRRRTEIGQNMQKLQQGKKQLRDERDEIKKRIDALIQQKIDPKSPEYQAEVAKLKEIEEFIQVADSRYQTEKATSAFNGIYYETVTEIKDPKTGVTESINRIHKKKPLVEEIYNSTVKEIEKIGLNKYDGLTNQKLNTLAMMDLSIIDLIVKDAKPGHSGYIYSEKFDGSVQQDQEARALTVVKAELSKEMDRIQTSIDQITDSVLKLELQGKYNDSKEVLEGKFGK